MAWLPDTNVWIGILKQPGGRLAQNLLRRDPSQIFLCSIVKAELWHGAQKYRRTDLRLKTLETLFADFVSLPFDDLAAWHYADIRHRLELAGRIIGPNDLKIAAICRANGTTLVSSNLVEFSRVPDLLLEDWAIE